MLIQMATKLGLKIPTFQKDLQDETLAEIVESNFESGVKSGVNGTPSFFINGHIYQGSYDFESLHATIEKNILALH